MIGLTPCRYPRPSSRREHVNASSNHKLLHKPVKKPYKSLYSAAAFKKSKITSGLSLKKVL